MAGDVVIFTETATHVRCRSSCWLPPAALRFSPVVCAAVRSLPSPGLVGVPGRADLDGRPRPPRPCLQVLPRLLRVRSRQPHGHLSQLGRGDEAGAAGGTLRPGTPGQHLASAQSLLLFWLLRCVCGCCCGVGSSWRMGGRRMRRTRTGAWTSSALALCRGWQSSDPWMVYGMYMVWCPPYMKNACMEHACMCIAQNLRRKMWSSFIQHQGVKPAAQAAIAPRLPSPCGSPALWPCTLP